MKLKQIYSKVERSKQRTIHSRSDSLQPDQPEIWHQISYLVYSILCEMVFYYPKLLIGFSLVFRASKLNSVWLRTAKWHLLNIQWSNINEGDRFQIVDREQVKCSTRKRGKNQCREEKTGWPMILMENTALVRA